MSGTWSTSGFAAAATSTLVWAGTRRGAAPGPAPQPAVKPAGVQVICNRGPDPDSLFTCTATVGGTTAPPTGSVKWSAGKGGFPGGATYCGTKHYVVGLSEALRTELRGSGVVAVGSLVGARVGARVGNGLDGGHGWSPRSLLRA